MAAHVTASAAEAEAPTPAPGSPEAGAATPARRRQVMRAFFAIARGFWSGPTRTKAWLLTAGVLVAALAALAVSLGVNRWQALFFDALERRDGETVLLAVGVFAGLAVAGVAAQVALVLARMRLQVRWRQWLADHLVARWLSQRRFYQLTIVGNEASNPEFRIADDGRLAIEPLVDFAVGLLNTILAAIAFIGVLWIVGGSITVGGLTIPGYMVIAVALYAALTSTAMLMMGRRIVGAMHEKNSGEAQLRYELTRVKDSAESIALIGGDDDERRRLTETFGELARRWIRLSYQQGRVTIVSHANFMFAGTVPLLLAAPKYLAGEYTLGAVMQLQGAFVAVQIALNWMVDNAVRLAEWYTSALRVLELADALDILDETIGANGTSETVVLGFSGDETIVMRNLSIAQQDGRLVIDTDGDIVIGKGEKILVRGESGTGKSTLIRTIAGLWPWGTGEILRPEGARMAFMPQRPYIPLGRLRNALLYPDSARDVADEALADALTRCGLAHLVPRLDEEDSWEQILSGGEKQRLAFARLLVAPPDYVIMDEATSALDEESQARMMQFLREDLQGATVISVGHRPGLEAYHTREIHLVRTQGGPAKPQPGRRPLLATLFGWR